MKNGQTGSPYTFYFFLRKLKIWSFLKTNYRLSKAQFPMRLELISTPKGNFSFRKPSFPRCELKEAPLFLRLVSGASSKTVASILRGCNSGLWGRNSLIPVSEVLRATSFNMRTFQFFAVLLITASGGQLASALLPPFAVAAVEAMWGKHLLKFERPFSLVRLFFTGKRGH